MYPPDDENTERDAGLEDDHKGQTGKPDLPELLIGLVLPLRPRRVEISRISVVIHSSVEKLLQSYLHLKLKARAVRGLPSTPTHHHLTFLRCFSALCGQI